MRALRVLPKSPWLPAAAVRTTAGNTGNTGDRETFFAHQAVLAAHSPFFKSQLRKADTNNMDGIALHGVEPDTFRVLLRFMYTDTLPGDDEES
ncbi:hypothetical protein EJB05_48129, partial [Eragrostis curvula]